MAMAWYPKALESFLQGDIDLSAVNVKGLLVSSGYTYSAAHDNLDDVAAGRLGLTGNLASKTFTNGTFDAADPTVTATADGTGNAVIWFVDTGTESTSKLLIYDDKEGDESTAISRPVLIDDTVVIEIDASGIGDL